MKRTLALTFHGPFVFDVQPNAVNVYAPICAGHRAGIFTPNDEYPLCGRHRRGGDYVYVFDAPVCNNLGKIIYLPKSKDSSSSTRILNGPSNTNVDKCQASFCISVPRPREIYGLNSSHTSVMKDNADTAPWATGLRFYYDCDFSRDPYVVLPEKGTLPLPLADLPSLPDYADIDIQYVGPDADDSEHQDAMSCFDQAMKLLNLGWWLYYGQPGEITTKARTGADCKSLAVVLDPDNNS
ncbi:MAG: hypothetical protein LAO30_22180 [Acidobacteriia bacterium]|nr:hypothetical protein [Terriglobia bacterium]